MAKFAFIDLDGVIADATARFEQAEQTANARYDKSRQSRDWTNAYWQSVFTPTNVELDMLMDGTHEALDRLQTDGYRIILLTSRPESMRLATLAWLSLHAVKSRALTAFPLICKPTGFQYVKTVVWKAGTIQMLAALHDADDVLVIDDEQMNLDEIQKYSNPFTLKCYTSLAMKDEPAPTVEDDNPF